MYIIENPWFIHTILGLFFSYGAVQILALSKVFASLVGVFGSAFLVSAAYYGGFI